MVAFEGEGSGREDFVKGDSTGVVLGKVYWRRARVERAVGPEKRKIQGGVIGEKALQWREIQGKKSAQEADLGVDFCEDSRKRRL